MRIEEEHQDVLRNVRAECERRLGREQMPVAQDEAVECDPIDVPTLVLYLKRLVKSVQKWNKHGGRQGCLAYITQFVM